MILNKNPRLRQPHVTVTPSGRLEVDINELLKLKKIRKQIEALDRLCSDHKNECGVFEGAACNCF